ncbi:hypothetical protein COO91_07418 [Nostoc flagelliforme CCNUN1]|uniref:Uncharacterized protein n=1 Tax=Nostoc flagelliforme CCNUN1 TaxID=2038116 RepID=A0A2K8T161_9NOSO|nr:hypothetical protein COO91_07418 [Nostoc flagelliforme CCNUN1]
MAERQQPESHLIVHQSQLPQYKKKALETNSDDHLHRQN